MEKLEMKNETRLRREYGGLATEPLEVAMSGAVLASSVVQSATVKTLGQEVGVVYDLSAEDGIDVNTGKTFSHEWESSGTE